MERDTRSAVVSLVQDTVVDAKCACNEVEEKETGVWIDIGQQADFLVEFSESGKYAITAYGEPVGEPAFCTVEAKLNDEMLTVFTIVGEDAKKGIGGVSRALEIEKGTYILSIKSRGGRGGCILEKISVGPAREENPNHYKPSDREEAVEYRDNWTKSSGPVYREIYVDPAGSDALDGTKEAPFRTLGRAKQEVAFCQKDMTGDIVVNLAPGYYELSETEVFGPEHGGNETCHVIYRGTDPENKPLLSGGKKVTGWTRYNEYLWRAPAPQGICHVRNLYVNGNPAVRARSKYTYACDEIYVDPNAPRILEVQYGDRHIQYPRKDGVIVSREKFPAQLSNYRDLEFVWSLIWTRQRTLVKGVEELEDGRLLFKMDPESFNTYHDVQGILPNSGAEFYIENAFELLDEPGEFYFNREEGYIYYFPYAQEDMEQAEAFVGNIQKMLHVEGTKEQPVRGLIFDNLDIRYGAWDYVSENGLFIIQADLMMYHENGVHKSRTVPAEIEILHADRIALTNCCIACQGASAMSFTDDVKNAKVIGNCIMDCSGAGIKVGNSALPGREDLTICENFAIENNVITRIGGEYAGCTAIICYYVSGARILHNTIRHTAYTGISIGWGWGCTDPKGNGGIVVRNNQVVDAMLSLHDGSHIYTLGPLRNSEIAYNYFGRTQEAGGGSGVYFDAGSGFINAHHNVTYVSEKGMSFIASGLHWIHNCRMRNYYANTRGYEVPGDIKSIDYEPPVLKGYGDPWPEEAQNIIENSGVNEDYKHLLEATVQPEWRKERLDTVPKKPFFARTIGTWMSAGDFINDEHVGWYKHKPQYWQNCCRMFEGVCMEYIPEIRGYVINETEPGEWVKYRVPIEKAGTYCVDILASGVCSGEELRPGLSIYFDDRLVIREFPIEKTAGQSDLRQQKLGEVELTEGLHIMKVEICGKGVAIAGFRFHDGSLYEADTRGVVYDEGVIMK